jgi:glycosyltransferase involved in cell wall biosynthesis
VNKPDISIVVCTHNRAVMLRDALESLLQIETAGTLSYEIVVVDNASTDATAQVVESLQQAGPVVRYVYEAKKGIATARNRGLREAAGEWIASFDDDQLADPRWLLELFAYAQQYNLRAVGGAVHLKLPEGCQRDLHPFVRMLLGESRLGNDPFPYSLKVSPGTGNLMLHCSVFEQVGTFDEAFAVRAEDTDLYCRIWRAGIEAWYVPAAIVHHVTPPARLEVSYLNRLASFLGGSIAQRERDTHPFPLFVMRWLAKVSLSPLILAAKLLMAKLSGHAEAQLGLSCHLQLFRDYTRRGGQILLQASSWRPAAGWSWFNHPAKAT